MDGRRRSYFNREESPLSFQASLLPATKHKLQIRALSLGRWKEGGLIQSGFDLAPMLNIWQTIFGRLILFFPERLNDDKIEIGLAESKEIIREQ